MAVPEKITAATLAGAGLGALLIALALAGGSVAQSQIINVTSNVSIATQVAASVSSNLSQGVQFGSISNLPQTNMNATHNNDSNSTELPGVLGAGNTSFYMNISTSTNVNVTVCFSANDSLRTSDGANTIPMSGYTWNSTTRAGNGTWFPWGGAAPASNLPPADANDDVNTALYEYHSNMANISVSGQPDNATVFFRFWLDIPSVQAPGDYYNILTFKTVRDTAGCGTYA